MIQLRMGLASSTAPLPLWSLLLQLGSSPGFSLLFPATVAWSSLLGGVNYVQREIYRAEGNFMRLTINQSKLPSLMTKAAHRGGNKGDISWEASERQEKLRSMSLLKRERQEP